VSLESRRATLAALTASVLFLGSSWVQAADQQPSTGGISELISRANPGDTVVVPAGLYRERLIISKPLTLEAHGKVEVVWQTEEHYEPALTCETADGVIVKSFAFKHASPSIANNYAVFLQGGSVTLEDCRVTSSTGTGVAAEGGEHTIRGCSLSGCERHGLAVFGTLDGDSCQVKLEGSSFEGNKLNGMLVRDQGGVELEGSCRVEGNGGHGIAVMYGSATIAHAAAIAGNKSGPVFEGPGADLEFV